MVCGNSATSLDSTSATTCVCRACATKAQKQWIEQRKRARQSRIAVLHSASALGMPHGAGFSTTNLHCAATTAIVTASAAATALAVHNQTMTAVESVNSCSMRSAAA